MRMRVLVRFLGGRRQRMLRNGHYQTAVLHAFEANQQVGKLGNLG